MERNKRIVFVPHCLLNQNVRALGTEMAPGPIRELLELFSEAGVGIVQMPCPEMEFDGGLEREPKAKTAFNEVYRKRCRHLAGSILKQIHRYFKAGYDVMGILGVEFCPGCAIYRPDSKRRDVSSRGILIEELESSMSGKRFRIPFAAVNLNNIYSSLEDVHGLLRFG